MTNTLPKDAFEKVAKNYAERVDTKPIHIYYERPNLWSLLPSNLTGSASSAESVGPWRLF